MENRNPSKLDSTNRESCENDRGVLVSLSSTEGHYIKDARRVVQLDDATESFFVEGKSRMVTANHTTLNINSDALVSTQVTYNPFTEVYQNSRD